MLLWAYSQRALHNIPDPRAHAKTMEANWVLLGAVSVLVGVAGVLWLAGSNGSDKKLIHPPIDDASKVLGFAVSFSSPGGHPAGELGVESTAMVADFKKVAVPADAPLTNPESVLVDGYAHEAASASGRVHTYTLHETEKAVVLVTSAHETASVIDAEEAKAAGREVTPFHYQQLRIDATAAYVLTFPAYHAAVQQKEAQSHTLSFEAALSRVLFVQSTGRCGSTLLSRAINSACGVVSVAEPDIYTALTFAWIDRRITRSELVQVLRDATYDLVTTTLAEAPGKEVPENVKVAIKMRSFVAMIGDILAEAVPEAKNMFLYRHPIPTTDSFCMAFARDAFGHTLHKLGLGNFLIRNTWLKDILKYVAPAAVADPPYLPEDTLKELGLVMVPLVGWMSVMEKAFEHSQRGVYDAILRYEELNEHKEHAVKVLLETLYPSMEVDETNPLLVGAFQKDAHGDNARTASARRKANAKGPMYISDRDLPHIEKLLAHMRHGIAERDFILPNTLLLNTDAVEELAKE